MNKHGIRFVLIVIFTFAFALSARSQINITGQVIEVTDGKTVVIETVARSKIIVKLQFIEIPDSAEPFAEIIREHLQKLVLGKNVKFETRRMSQFSMITGVLSIGAVDLSQQMLRDGAAWYALAEKDEQNASERKIYLATEAAAKTEKRGVWSDANSKLARAVENSKPAKSKT